jgi:hypothetical protein
MNKNLLFKNTKLRLTCYYAGVMGVILSICGLGVYEAIAHAHWMTLDREIKSVAETLHDSLETVLQEPGFLEPDVLRIIPDLCLIKSDKNIPLNYPNLALNCLPTSDEKTKKIIV